MKRRWSIGLLTLALLGFLAVFSGSALATTYQELSDIYDSQLAGGGITTIDGHSVEIFEFNGFVEILVDGEIVGSTIDANDRAAILQALAEALGISLTSAGSIDSPIAAAATTSRLVFTELVVPTVKTTTEMRKFNEQKSKGGVRTFGGSIRGEWVDYAGTENGRITGFTLGLAYDVDDYTFGVILPYDYFDFDSFDANRLGSIFFGQYHLALSEELEATFTANLNYMYADFDYGRTDDDLSTYGGGLSAGLKYGQEDYEAGIGLSYQYNQDNTDTEDDDQHLLKTGANVGVRVTPDQVVNLFLTWNYDFTDYKYDHGDDDYFEIGTEYRANFSETWGINVGYRKVVDLEDFDSDMVYLGTVWQF